MNSVAEAIFYGFAGAMTIAWLWRELPLQYVLTVAVVTASISALACLAMKTDCWWLPLIVLNSRGVARLVLQRWHERPYYGWWIMGLACVLSTALAPRWNTPILALVMQIAAMPWLIKRRPASVPGYLPLLTFGLIVAGGLLGFLALA